MRILHVLAQKPSNTGSGVYFTSVIDGLAAFGHEQCAVFAYQQENTFSILDKEYQYPVAFQTEALPFSIVGMSDVMPYPNTRYKEMDESMLVSWKYAFREILQKVKNEFQPDIVISHHLWMLTSLVIETFPNTPIVGVCHNTDLRQAHQNPLLKEEHVLGMEKLAGVFALSPMQHQEICETFDVSPDIITTIGGGFNEKIFYPLSNPVSKDKIEMVFCAKIDKSKGIYELLPAFHALAEKYPHLFLDIIGNPNELERKRLESLIEEHPRISVYQVANQEVLGDVLRSKDIFVMPSFFEGLGLMAIESLASGLWTVTTEIEALMALLGPGLNQSGVIEYIPLPRIYDTDKPMAEDLPTFQKNLIQALEVQIKKVVHKERISKKNREQIDQHSWTNIVKRIEQVIIQIVTRRSKSI